MRVAVSCDHAGQALCEIARGVLRRLGHEVIDMAPPQGQKVDYPDIAGDVARAVAEGRAERGVLVCGTGIGVSIAASKIRGIRAALVHDTYTAQMARAHNDANILCLGERVIGPGEAEACVDAFFSTDFEGGRHRARLDKITKLENA